MSDTASKGKVYSNEMDLDEFGGCYVIHLKEQLSPDWSETYEGLTLTYAVNGETILSGSLPDQAALHGLLARIRDLNLTLISVRRASFEEFPEEKFSKKNQSRTGCSCSTNYAKL